MKGIRIRPDHQGIRAWLFDLEADIMEVVWSRDWSQFSVSEVHEQLGREREIAYTTVMTTVSRLFSKGLLDRRRDGKRYLYAPVMGRAAFLVEMANEVLGSLQEAGLESAVALLAEQVSEANTETLDELEALIRARRRELKA